MKKNWDDIVTEYVRHWKFVERLAQEKKTNAELVEDFESEMKKQAKWNEWYIIYDALQGKKLKYIKRLYTNLENYENKIICLWTKFIKRFKKIK